MAIYRFAAPSAIDTLEIITNAQGGVRAYLHARSDTSTEQLKAMEEAFTQHGWVGFPIMHQNTPTLELRGFDDPKTLLSFLAEKSFTQGTPQETLSNGDTQSLSDKFRNATLKNSGFTYIAGDAAFMFYAVHEMLGNLKDRKLAETISARVADIKNIHDRGDRANAIEALRSEFRALGEVEKVSRVSDDLANLTAKAGSMLSHGVESVKGSKLKIGSGVGYAVGSVILSQYGSHDQSSVDIDKKNTQVERFLKSEGFIDPNNDDSFAPKVTKASSGVLGAIDSTLRRFPSEALNIIYTGVGLGLMSASFRQIGVASSSLKSLNSLAQHTKAQLSEIKDLRKHLGEERLDVGLGTITTASALAGLLIKEKKPLKGREKREGLAGVWDWIEEQPLRATGYGYLAATGVHALTTFGKWQLNDSEKLAKPFENAIKSAAKGQPLSKELQAAKETLEGLKSRRIGLSGRWAFIALSMLAEGLLIVSSKGHGEGVHNEDVDDSVIATTARFIAHQNPAQHEVLIQRLAGYMSSPEVLGIKSEVIAADLRAQLAGMQQNPWVDAARTAQPDTKIHDAVLDAPKKDASAKSSQSWQSQLLGEKASGSISQSSIA